MYEVNNAIKQILYPPNFRIKLTIHCLKYSMVPHLINQRNHTWWKKINIIEEWPMEWHCTWWWNKNHHRQSSCSWHRFCRSRL